MKGTASSRERWRSLPNVIQLIVVVSAVRGLVALVDLAELLGGNWKGNVAQRELLLTVVLVVACGVLAYGAWCEQRYTRALVTVLLATHPFVGGEVSWRTITAAAVNLILALWFLYWNDEVTDYYILLEDRVANNLT